MKREAKVVWHGGRLMAAVSRGEACKACGACSLGRSETVYAPLPEGDFREGDEVQVELSEGGVSKASLLAYGLPLAGLVIGLALGCAASRLTGWNADLTELGLALVGTAAGFGLIRRLEPLIRKMPAFQTECQRVGRNDS